MEKQERVTGGEPLDLPGIPWEPGDEDYPFPSVPGETALDFFARWLESAGYARVSQGGVRYIHEADVANLVNHITADVGLLRARLGTFGDRVVTAETFDAAEERIEQAAALLAEVGDQLRQARG